MDLAQTFHNSDNPVNLSVLLNSALKTGFDQIAPAVIQTSNRPVVGEVPGKPDPTPQKQVDEAKNNAAKKSLPIALGLGALVVISAIMKD